MEQGKNQYIIGVGNTDDWDAGRGSLYFIEGRDAAKYLPVFTTPERIEEYIKTFLPPKAQMEMLESVPVTHAPTLTEGRFIVMPLNPQGLAMAANLIDADYLIRDPREGAEQEILRVPKGEE